MRELKPQTKGKSGQLAEPPVTIEEAEIISPPERRARVPAKVG
jgi:hypothetical protein